jgi:hypothetical protein
MNDLGAVRPPRTQPEPLFPFRSGQNRGDDHDPTSIFPSSGTQSSDSPYTYRHTTFRSGPVSGTATFTIVSSNVPGAATAINVPEGSAAPPGFPPGFPT